MLLDFLQDVVQVHGRMILAILKEDLDTCLIVDGKRSEEQLIDAAKQLCFQQQLILVVQTVVPVMTRLLPQLIKVRFEERASLLL